MQLDAEQAAAVATDASRVLCMACPGSGKTTTLVARLKWMQEGMGISPSRIVAITFTRAAAAEIRKRLGSVERHLYVGTLHAFCLKLIMEYGGALGYDREWLSIIDDEEASLDEREVLCDFGLVRKKLRGWDWCGVRAADWERFSMCMTSGLPVADAFPKGSRVVDLLTPAWNAYVQRLRAQNVLTYGTLLSEAYALLQDPAVADQCSARWHHFLVDEAQDTSHIQWSIVFRLVQAMSARSLFVVGDVDQSLYSWRGAAPACLIDMSKDPAVRTFPIANSYRFGPEIAGAAQRLIEHNVARIPMTIVPKGPAGKVAVMHDVYSGDLIATVRKLVDEFGAGGVAVLGRTHAVLDGVGAALRAGDVPCEKVGRLGALRKTGEFRTVVGYLRLMNHAADRRGFMAVSAAEGFTREDILVFRERAAVELIPLSAASGLDARIPDSLDALERYLQGRDPTTDYRFVFDFLRVHSLYEGLVTPQEILNWLALCDVQDELRVLDAGKVPLMTVHAAKGLEWDAVVVVGLNDGTWPSSSSAFEGSMEEERRLCYVAMTRAKRHLVLVTLADDYTPGPQRWLRLRPIPSRFVFEAVESGVSVAQGERS